MSPEQYVDIAAELGAPAPSKVQVFPRQPSAFGRAMKAARETSGVSLAQLGARIGLSASHLCFVESGRRGAFPLDRVREVARALGVPEEPLVAAAAADLGLLCPHCNRVVA